MKLFKNKAKKLAPVVQENSLVDINSLLVVTPQVVYRGQAQLLNEKSLQYQWYN